MPFYMGKKAKELTNNPTRLKKYVKPNMEGRISHDELWHNMLANHKPGMRCWVEFPKEK